MKHSLYKQLISIILSISLVSASISSSCAQHSFLAVPGDTELESLLVKRDLKNTDKLEGEKHWRESTKKAPGRVEKLRAILEKELNSLDNFEEVSNSFIFEFVLALFCISCIQLLLGIPLSHLVKSFIIFPMIIPIFEELLYRKIIFKDWLLKRFHMGVYTSILISTLIFVFVHDISIGSFGFVYFGGLLCASLYVRKKSLIYPIVTHSIWNFIIALIGIKTFKSFEAYLLFTVLVFATILIFPWPKNARAFKEWIKKSEGSDFELGISEKAGRLRHDRDSEELVHRSN